MNQCFIFCVWKLQFPMHAQMPHYCKVHYQKLKLSLFNSQLDNLVTLTIKHREGKEIISQFIINELAIFFT